MSQEDFDLWEKERWDALFDDFAHADKHAPAIHLDDIRAAAAALERRIQRRERDGD